MGCPHFAVALHEAKDRLFARTALLTAFAVARMAVLFFAADKGCVAFDGPFKRRVEGICPSRMTKSMQHKPSGFLSYADILCQSCRSNSLRVISYHPDRSKPFAQRYLRVFEDGSHLYRKALAAITALKRLPV
jgi:hypothetical protein